MRRIIVTIGVTALLAFAAALAQAQTCTTPDATIISPTPGSVLPSSGTVTFSWCNASADYFVIVETVPGAHDIFYAFTGGAGGGAGQNFLTFPIVSSLPNALCQPVPPIGCIPALGEAIHFTLDTVKAKTLLGSHLYDYTAGGSGGSTGVWKGGTGVWSNALNWTGGVPNGNVNVFIDNSNALASAVTLDMNATIGDLNVDADDRLTLKDSTTLTVEGPAVHNAGNIFISSAGNPTAMSIGAGQSVSLGLTGKITLSETIDNGNAFISGGSGSTLTNAGNTIQGAGELGHGSGLALVNQAKGIISASTTFGLKVNALGGVSNAGTMKAMGGRTLTLSSLVTNTGTISTTGVNSKVLATSSLSNPGKLMVGAGGTIALTGPFSNFSGTTSTLTGGTYMVTGTLQFPNANVAKNGAAITLTGTASKIVDQLANNGLRNLASNLTSGSLTLQSGRLLTTSGAFSNAGKVLINAGTGFGTATGTKYTQTAGRTTVDGSLSAPGGMTITAGMLFGKGTIQSAVSSSGSVTPGDSVVTAGQLSIAGSYSQTATGTLNISIGGLTVATQYDRLAVTNGVSLNGKLALKLINGFVPAIGSSFTIVTGSAVTGTFPTVTGLSINAGEHFKVNYGPTSVTVTVVSGP
jgi:fibronectin-binding autotransporter adhesin